MVDKSREELTKSFSLEELKDWQAIADEALRYIIESTSKVTGEEFLKTLARQLALTLDLSYILIGELSGKDDVQTLVVWAKGQFVDNFKYDLADTPCENVAGKVLCFYKENIQKLFPKDKLLVDMGVESYIGVPLFGSDDKPLGIIVGLDEKAMTEDPSLIFTFFAARAGLELERKRGEDEKKKIHDELERRIEERTAALMETNKVLREQILERVRAEAALAESEELYRTLAESAEDFICIVGRDLCFRYVNSFTAEFIGKGKEELKGMPIEQILPPPLYSQMRESLEDVFSTGKGRFDERNFSSIGKELWLGTRFNPIFDADGSVKAVLGISRDITERKRTEQEREKLIAELKGALANVKTLSGLLPICASCKKIRDDRGYWKKIEIYIQEHSEADFSHGICPDCVKKF